jgi:hypothetical protein
MRTQRLWLIGFGVLLATQVQAASIGVFCWQLFPTVDVLCFDIDNAPQQARAFALSGTDFVVGDYRTPVTGGVAFDEYAGLYRMNWTTYFTTPAIFHADLNPQTLQGPFFSSFGGQGTMLFLGGSAAADVASSQNVGENQMDQRTLSEQMQ